jgi:ferric-dicitrate binding protein FerR (iron transport regulator)
MDEQVGKYYQGELTPQERVDLLRKAESDEQLKEAFIRHLSLQALLDLVPQAGDRFQAQVSYAKFIKDDKRRISRKRFTQILSYAAMAACLIGVTWLLAGQYFSTGETGSGKFNTLFVPAGQGMRFTLEDGTIVWLNAQTRLTYPTEFSAKERHVTVEGEAYFEVTRDASRPFIVSTGDVDIKVLGTTFNIYNYPAEPYSRISLIEGSLAVYNPKKPSKYIKLKPQEEITVRGNQMTVAKIKDNNYFLWKEGIYSFNNELFENILKKLELYYDITIEVNDPAMLQWRYTVKFRQRDGIDEIFRLMQQIHKFTIVRDEENNRLIIRK